MTLRHLRIFVAVCEEGSVTLAAEKLYLSQPAVSLAIHELEEHYGVRLFDRISRKLYLTSAGNRFLEYAVHISSLFDEMERDIQNWDTLGALRIGSSITIGAALIPKAVALYSQQYPDVEIQMVIDNSQVIEKKVLANEVDFGLLEGAVHDPNLVAQDFAEDQMLLVAAPGHPLAQKEQPLLPQDLKSQRFLLRERGSGVRELFESVLLAHDLSVEPSWESINAESIVEAVVQGLGVTALPYALVKQDLAAGRLTALTVEGMDFRRKLKIIYHKNKYLSRSAKAFLELCRQLASQFLLDSNP